MSEQFDLIVLGSGSGARDGANTAAKEHDARVALIENTRWGGSCPNVACKPTKAYLVPAELARDIETPAKPLGIEVGPARTNLAKVKARKACLPHLGRGRQGSRGAGPGSASVAKAPTDCHLVAAYHGRGVKKAANVAATIGGILAIVEGLLLIVLGSLAGLAQNPESEAAMTDGYLVLALGGIILVAVFAARRSPIVLAAACASTAAVGFLVENALWVFAAASLLAASAFAVVSKRGDSDSPIATPGPRSRPGRGE